ncbi:hypothetical protein QVD17_24866 [Tagetes erecta]|uniref:Methyltransferase type 11 domain-containing protein n=1 Tax=Tagetes erecta TaxID=13708 RepID=A0AAD8NMY1_TARER|nr:hypothetical protein QVD17_24866 [Tagetes erecta]
MKSPWLYQDTINFYCEKLTQSFVIKTTFLIFLFLRMAEGFVKQAKQYSEARPRYPPEMFDFIASKTPCHDVAWDVGTGNGQAATSLVSIYKSVVATDTSKKQLEFAPKLSNIRYECTSPNMSMSELEEKIGPESSVDLVTVAQALQWFDLDTFYNQVKWILKKPSGVIAVWCYTLPNIDDEVDLVLQKSYMESKSYLVGLAREMIEDKFANIKFPFDPVAGCDHTGPFEFQTKKLMTLDELFTFIRSASPYQTAREQGVELLNDGVIEEFKRAWKEDANCQKNVVFPVYLRIGKLPI